MEGFKFTDQDIREDQDLIGEAVQYALNYKGNFDLILDAKYLAEQNGTLPPGVARAVLNTALTDPRAHLEGRAPERPRPADRWRHGYNEDKVVVKFPTAYDPYDEKKDKIKSPYLLKVKWNKEFFWSTEKAARRYHILDTRRSFIKYFPATKGYQIDLKSVCCSLTKWIYTAKYEYNNNTPEKVKVKCGNLRETPSYLTECPRCRLGYEEFESGQ